MTESFKGTAFVTGASSGLGAIYADRLAKRGYDLVLIARDQARLEALAARLHRDTGSRVVVLPADLSDAAQIAHVAQTIAAAPDIALLVNNAGISLTGTLGTSSAEEAARLVMVNVLAPTLLAQAALQAFKTKAAGAMINIASVLALAPEMFDGAYSGTKAYMLNLSQGLTHETQGTGIHIQAVLPGATRTEIWERSGKDVDAMPADMVMSADDLVDAALLGFDRGETVTIPPLHDLAGWDAMQAARIGLAGQLSRREVASRYREAVTL
ncbi:SDR family NAD(P)-dependent oxidoreductase [Novosphingobium sp.]|uniref:SDR family NAD(P)-dependent oxidoreductase n=1 Tax=Novosphingobium sp. TaxID=1874826 RepID=UPI003D09EBC9